MGEYKIRVSVEIFDEDGAKVYGYSELLQSGGRTQVIKTRESANNIVSTMAKDVRKICLVRE